MTLYSNPASIHSHRTRIVLAEKGIVIDIVSVAGRRAARGPARPQSLPLHAHAARPGPRALRLPRDHGVHRRALSAPAADAGRPGQPGAGPPRPVPGREGLVHRWPSSARRRPTRSRPPRCASSCRKACCRSADVFAAKRFFLSDEFSLVDASVAPLLWRLPVYGIELNGSAAQPIRRYMDSMFARRSFQESLTDVELEMRQ